MDDHLVILQIEPAIHPSNCVSPPPDMQTKSNSNAVTSKRLNSNSMANSSNITNNTASTNGELNVVSSASLVTAKAQQQAKSADLTQQLTTSSTASPHVITVVTPTSTSQPHGEQEFRLGTSECFSDLLLLPTNIQSLDSKLIHPLVPLAGQQVVLQVGSNNNAQYIALVQSDQTDSNGNAALSVTDEEQNSNFDELCSGSYSNGNTALTYYAAADAGFGNQGSANYFSSNSQVLGDGTYLVMEQGENHLSPNSLCAGNAKQQSNDSQAMQLADEDLKQLLLQQQRSISVQPQTVKWLLDNYESAEGVSLPRSALYTHYNEHCQEHRIEPVNAASFGKLIRSVFIGLRTRRLGTRGNSKYHYYGIRIKPGSTLAKNVDQICNSNSSGGNLSHGNQPPSKKPKTSNSFKANSNSNCTVAIASESAVVNSSQPVAPAPPPPSNTLSAATIEELKIYLGDPTTLLQSVWPEVPTISSNDSDSPNALLNRFAFCYRRHYEQVINAIGSLQFAQVEQLWTEFWQSTNRNDKEALSLEQLHQLTIPNLPVEDSGEEEPFNSLANWIVQTDYTLYNSLISSLLLPNLLKPIPQQLTLQIRNFAKNMVNWMKQSLTGYDATFVQLKCSAVSAFSHTLRRYTSLNHLSSAARSVLQNYMQVQQMISDLGKVDFRNLQEQANWGCDCEDTIVDQIENSFKSLLQEPQPSEKWPIWCEQIMELCLQVICGFG